MGPGFHLGGPGTWCALKNRSCEGYYMYLWDFLEIFHLLPGHPGAGAHRVRALTAGSTHQLGSERRGNLLHTVVQVQDLLSLVSVMCPPVAVHNAPCCNNWLFEKSGRVGGYLYPCCRMWSTAQSVPQCSEVLEEISQPPAFRVVNFT